jgi:hypothetical protein
MVSGEATALPQALWASLAASLGLTPHQTSALLTQQTQCRQAMARLSAEIQGLQSRLQGSSASETDPEEVEGVLMSWDAAWRKYHSMDGVFFLTSREHMSNVQLGRLYVDSSPFYPDLHAICDSLR